MPETTGPRPAIKSVVGARIIHPLADFLKREAASGYLLLGCVVIALLWANGPWRDSYETVWGTEFSLRLGAHDFTLDLRHWVNDGLMALFFFVIGLELKREFVEGELRERRQVIFPLCAAIGGMAVPALLYVAATVNREGVAGWGIPMATDTAIALGVIGLLGSRVSAKIKALLLAVAILDDVGAILVLALVYSSHQISLLGLAIAALLLVVMWVLRFGHMAASWMYLVLAVAVWTAVFAAGVHATLAGVALALVIPTQPLNHRDYIDADDLLDLSSYEAARDSVALARGSVSRVEWLQHLLHPWSSFVILPIFALANAGIAMNGSELATAVRSPVFIGVVLGLALGKPVGIMLGTMVAKRIARISQHEIPPMRDIAGMGMISGIGFTMSVFISDLALADGGLRTEAKAGILAGSLIAGLAGFLFFRFTKAGNPPDEPKQLPHQASTGE